MKNKVVGALIVTLLISGMSIGQEEGKEITRPKHEINIGFANILNPYRIIDGPDYYPLSNYESFDLVAGPNDYIYQPYPYYQQVDRSHFGLGYKFHFGKNAIRFSTSFGFSSEDTDADPTAGNYSSSSTSRSNFSARIGFERTIIRLEIFDFYTALDGIYSQSSNNFESKSYNPSGSYYSKNDYTYDELGAGISLGVRVFVHKNISFSTETQINFTTAEARSKFTSSADGQYPYSSTSGSNNIIQDLSINPLGILSLNVHF